MPGRVASGHFLWCGEETYCLKGKKGYREQAPWAGSEAEAFKPEGQSKDDQGNLSFENVGWTGARGIFSGT